MKSICGLLNIDKEKKAHAGWHIHAFKSLYLHYDPSAKVP